LRKFALFAAVVAVLGFASLASAQQGDAMFGFGTLMSSGTCNNNTGFCPEKGGLYPNVGADVIFHQRLGIGFDVAWRGSQASYPGFANLPFRPILYSFNGVYQPRITKKVGADVFAGLGWQSTRFYSANYTCSYFSCTNYASSNHFLIDAGAGLRYYFWGHVFVRPEIRYYYVNNNTNDFSSNNLFRAGASIGYTIGPD
jgi:opacity protein-like surface antigen